VEETDRQGRTQRTTHTRTRGAVRRKARPISPLLSNLYMRRFRPGLGSCSPRAAASREDRQLRR